MASQSSTPGRSRLSNDAMDQWSVGVKIGKGSFATVYSGTYKKTGAFVAIKSVELGKLKGKVKENLYTEIKILETLRHPHIVALHECVETPSHIHLMMEYCELGDLSLFIKKREFFPEHPATKDMARKYPGVPNGGLNEVIIRHFLKQLASALEFLRGKNLIHRDIKPQNLLLLPSPVWREQEKHKPLILSASNDSLIPAAGLRSLPMLKLADFGFARVLPSTSLAETLCGSPLYMAPEILRYERYDAKADLWSMGTVLYEMAAGRAPFRATNHVELLRKIEAGGDVIKFPRETVLSVEMKSLIRALLKRSPVERISFEAFFTHDIVTGQIPGLVEEDLPRPAQPRRSHESITASRTSESDSLGRKSSLRRYGTDRDPSGGETVSSPVDPVERPYRRSPLSTPTETEKQLGHYSPRLSYSPRQEVGQGLGIRRPQPVPSTSAPARPTMYETRRRGQSNASAHTVARDGAPSGSTAEQQGSRSGRNPNEHEKAEQEIAFERDYVVVDKNQVAVNALADELAANGRMTSLAQGQSPQTGQMVRRITTQGAPDSITGAVAPSPSRAVQIAQGRRPNVHERKSSLSVSPGSATKYISRAIQETSLRLLGIKNPPLLGKGASPPQLYNPFPAYPTPSAPVNLIGDGKQTAPYDEDARVAQCIEEIASRSDVVYGFAEVKYKQLVPLAPSMDHGLGGVPADGPASNVEDGLTPDAVVSLSEEALVLYVKALSLLAKSMDVASLWWSRRTRSEASGGHASSARDSGNTQNLTPRINAVVQWVRSRFNEVLEKAEVEHPSHPSNHSTEAGNTGGSAVDGVVITPGISAEKLMYDRAVEMSRKAAIDEISNEDLVGCEISYVTAICMLEAVLDSDEDLPKRRVSGPSKEERATPREDTSEINADDQQAIRKLIGMITGRLTTVRRKLRMIASATKQQQQTQTIARRRSGDGTPRSLSSQAS
ncbi:hypothetical protein M406DRAFT_66486 [Cryphonectria parasitica EP155]|uniref:non-specific serine/threonine protein kinase n=1 Tax=Cryphonectria parasitica (strain ATCC 38755 / EP155) TaxID=660469 RepID=A0A9P4YBN0_CRYP1|nr:uncharacterized protein M406DRAFT_66486 [Cryphonectria parasitica EP155]KAF3770039.1 hypothetical protein M406DRAFT_66486 [Cryphonectria parasitica EP155]